MLQMNMCCLAATLSIFDVFFLVTMIVFMRIFMLNLITKCLRLVLRITNILGIVRLRLKMWLNYSTIYLLINHFFINSDLSFCSPLFQGQFSLSINERFRVLGGYVGLLEWIMGIRKQNWVGFLTRQVLEEATSYEEAMEMLEKPKLLAPVYFILSSNNSKQVCRNHLNFLF